MIGLRQENRPGSQYISPMTSLRQIGATTSIVFAFPLPLEMHQTQIWQLGKLNK